MKNYILLFVLTIIAFNVNAQSQKIKPVPHLYKYQQGQTFYEFKELEPFFQKFPDTQNLWKKYQDQNKAGQITAGFGAGFILIAAIVMKPPPEDMYCDLACINGERFLLATSGTLATIVGLGITLGKEGKKTKLVKMYNAHFEEDLGEGFRSSELKFGVGAGGVGLRLSF